MALVNVSNVIVHNNPTHFTAPFQFEVTFECVQELQDGESSEMPGWLALLQHIRYDAMNMTTIIDYDEKTERISAICDQILSGK